MEDIIMKTSTMIIILGLCSVLYFSCKDKSTDPETQQSVAFSSQSSKCLSQGLPRHNYFDSLFTYSFNDSLIIDFTVIANCCPDSNRFSISYNIRTDTLIISIADTAENLCDCICPYMIHTEFWNLPADHYIVRCNLQNYKDPIYLVEVHRK